MGLGTVLGHLYPSAWWLGQCISGWQVQVPLADRDPGVHQGSPRCIPACGDCPSGCSSFSCHNVTGPIPSRLRCFKVPVGHLES